MTHHELADLYRGYNADLNRLDLIRPPLKRS